MNADEIVWDDVHSTICPWCDQLLVMTPDKLDPWPGTGLTFTLTAMVSHPVVTRGCRTLLDMIRDELGERAQYFVDESLRQMRQMRVQTTKLTLDSMRMVNWR